MKIQGFDKLQRELARLQKVLSGLDGELMKVSFDPEDPASIEAAIQQVERAIDEKAGSYPSNSVAASLIEGMKAQDREQILERAARARLEGSLK